MGEPSCRRVCAVPFLSGHAYRVWATLVVSSRALAAHESSDAEARPSRVADYYLQGKRYHFGARFSRNALMPSRASASSAFVVITPLV